MIKTLTRRSVIFSCLAAGSLGMSPAAPPPQQPSEKPAPTGASKSLEDLLKETSFTYTKMKDGVFKVAVENDGEVSLIVLQERTPPWKARDGSPVKYVALFTQITPRIPKDQKLPAAMLMRLAELNDGFDFGNLGLNVSEQQAVFYNAAFFLRNADSEVLTDYLVVTHYSRLRARKELLPFLQEGGTSGGQ
jgi:hypothetical protein